MSDARLLTIRQVSEYLFGDYTPSLRNRVYHIIEANDLTHIKDGKQWYVAKDVLDRLIGVEQ